MKLWEKGARPEAPMRRRNGSYWHKIQRQQLPSHTQGIPFIHYSVSAPSSNLAGSFLYEGHLTVLCNPWQELDLFTFKSIEWAQLISLSFVQTNTSIFASAQFARLRFNAYKNRKCHFITDNRYGNCMIWNALPNAENDAKNIQNFK